MVHARLACCRRPINCVYCAPAPAPFFPLQAGDIFQLVLSQRFERRTFADPFEIYRRGWAGWLIISY